MKSSQKLLSISCHQKKIFFLCLYIMVDISVKTWNQAEVAATNIHEDDDVNKTILLILCISDASKR